jgi:hypothetical protein
MSAGADFIETYCDRRKRNVWSRPEAGGPRVMHDRSLCPSCAVAPKCPAREALNKIAHEHHVTAPVYECPMFKQVGADDEW